MTNWLNERRVGAWSGDGVVGCRAGLRYHPRWQRGCRRCCSVGPEGPGGMGPVGGGEGLLPATLCAGVMMHMFIVVSCLCCIIYIVISLLLLYHVYCCINRNDDDPHSPQSQPYGNRKWFFSAPWRNYHLNQKVLPPE